MSVSVGVPSVSVLEPLAVCPTFVGEPMRVVEGVGCTRERGDADFVTLFVRLHDGVFEDCVLERELVPPVKLFVWGMESDSRLILRNGVSVRLRVGVLELLVPVPESVRVLFFSALSPVALSVGTSDRIALSVSVNDGVTLLYVSDGSTDCGLSLNVRDLLLVSFLSFSSVRLLSVNDGVTLLYDAEKSTDSALPLNVRVSLLVSSLFSPSRVGLLCCVIDGVTLSTVSDGSTERVFVRDALLYISDGDTLS